MKRLLPALVALSVLSACAVVPTTPTTPPDPNVVSYTAIGASDAIGYGSSFVCVPFVPCDAGMGYVQLLQRRLKADGKTVSLNNLGLPGFVLSPEIQAIGNSLSRDIVGNFLENEMPFVDHDATLVTVFAGGNDVNTIGAAIDAGLGGSDPAGYQTTRTQNFGRDLHKLMAGIKARAPTARVVVVNVPNLAALPYAAGYSLQKKQALQSIAVGFSAQANSLQADGALIVDVMCDATFYLSNLYSSDGFHPNDAGYQHLADVVYAPASTGVATPPKTSCASMAKF